jgi:hypothetical protein
VCPPGTPGRKWAISRVTPERVSSPDTAHRPDDGTSRNDVLEYCK